jgi:predicted DCC family thiol-disulfide oxidoreductase YuxK
VPTGEPLLIFDGACGFCTAAVDWLRARLVQPVRIEPWQRTDLAAFGIGPEDARRTVWWIDASGRAHHSEQAVGRALGACGAGWPLVGRVLRAPVLRHLFRLGYRLVARHRHRLPGTTPALRR